MPSIMFRSSAIAQRALATLLAVATLPAVAHPGGRLDPDERQRLRGELRQQMQEDRARMRAEHEERARLRAERAGDAPGWRLGRWSDMAPGTPPMGGGPFGPPAEGAPPPASALTPPPAHPPPQRLSADEREQLRRQLREARFRQGP